MPTYLKIKTFIRNALRHYWPLHFVYIQKESYRIFPSCIDPFLHRILAVFYSESSTKILLKLHVKKSLASSSVNFYQPSKCYKCKAVRKDSNSLTQYSWKKQFFRLHGHLQRGLNVKKTVRYQFLYHFYRLSQAMCGISSSLVY